MGAPQPERRAGLAPTFLLTLSVVIAGSALLTAAAMALVPATPLSLSPTGEQHQNAETLAYLGSFGVILPLALRLVPRLADRVAAGPNGRGLPLLAGLLAAVLAAAILFARVSGRLPWGYGLGTVAAAAGVWGLTAAVALRRASGPRPWNALLSAADSPRPGRVAFAVAAALVAALALGLTAVGDVSPLGAAIAGAAGLGAIVASERLGLGRLRGRLGLLFDLAAAAVIGLAVIDVVIFLPDGAASDPLAAFDAAVYAFHQNFILGPAAVVLGGGAVLVDTASQYGVGPVYLAAGWSELAGLGYGTFGLLDGVLMALLYVSSYALLRMAGAPRPLAAAALLVGVVVLVYNLAYPVGALPQHGPLRYGLPMVVVVCLVAEARRGRPGPSSALALGAVGLSALWAIEAFVFTAATFVAVRAFEVAFLGRPLRRGLRDLALAAAACLLAHLAFALATLAAAGEFPDWGQYLAFLDAFLGGLGDITYDFAAWSPGLAVAALYAASLAGLILIGMRRREVIAADPPLWVALAGVTAYGTLLFSYFVDRSLDHVLLYVAAPALLTAVLWLTAGLRHPALQQRESRRVMLGAAAAAAALLVGAAWGRGGERLGQSALAHALPGGEGLRAAIDRLRNPPPIDSRAPAGEALLRRYAPGDPRVLILVSPDLQTEILLRTGLLSELPFSHPREDSFVAEEHTGELRDSAAGLRAGEVLLTDTLGLRAFRVLRAEPERDPLTSPVAPDQLASLQEYALREIGRRFDLRVVARDPAGYVVARLVPARA